MKRRHLHISAATLCACFVLVALAAYHTELTAAMKNRTGANSKATTQAAYKGSLYATSEKVGAGNPLILSTLLKNMKRNGVDRAVFYVEIEDVGCDDEFCDDDEDEEDEDDDKYEDVMNLQTLLSKGPGKIVPFFSTGKGGDEEGELAGPKLLKMYEDGYALAKEKLGDSVVKGIGELELYAWDMPHNDQRVFQLLDFASKNGLSVMFHPLPGKKKEVEAILKKYPKTTFLMHMFPEDFSRDRQMVIDLMTRYSNLYFTVDIDHMLFDAQKSIGLLYKFENSSIKTAVSSFKTDFDKQRAQLLKTAISRYRPLITAHPDRVTWGTEMSKDYTYDKDVYDRMIGFVREFIGSMPKDVQEKIAYKNAQRIFGGGVELKTR